MNFDDIKDQLLSIWRRILERVQDKVHSFRRILRMDRTEPGFDHVKVSGARTLEHFLGVDRERVPERNGRGQDVETHGREVL